MNMNMKMLSMCAILGGVIAGIVAFAAAVLAKFLWRRRKRPDAGVNGARQSFMGESRLPVLDDGTYAPLSQSMPRTPTYPMKLYVRVSMSPSRGMDVLMLSFLFSYSQDPNDPTTFPLIQGAQSVPKVPMATYNESGRTSPMAHTQTSQPMGYHGYPTV
jgi:hypothetical protein